MIHWQAAADAPALDAADIHVWCLPAVAAPDALAWLDSAERARLDAMADAAGRARLLATRAGLRRVLAAYLGCTPQAVELTIAPGGKPHLANGPAFNLSHSGDLALLAVAPRQVGIDVERRRKVPRALAIARRVLDTRTASELAAVPAEQLDEAFLSAWTAMEARQKCLGEGVFGQPVAAGAVGGLAFTPDPGHLGHLAWELPDMPPRISWLSPVS